MTRRQLFKNFGFGLAGILALPLFGKPGKASEPVSHVPWLSEAEIKDLHPTPVNHEYGWWGSNLTMHTGPLTLERVDNELRAMQSVRFS